MGTVSGYAIASYYTENSACRLFDKLLRQCDCIFHGKLPYSLHSIPQLIVSPALQRTTGEHYTLYSRLEADRVSIVLQRRKTVDCSKCWYAASVSDSPSTVLMQSSYRLASTSTLGTGVHTNRVKAIADISYPMGIFSEKIALSTGSVFAGWQVL